MINPINKLKIDSILPYPNGYFSFSSEFEILLPTTTRKFVIQSELELIPSAIIHEILNVIPTNSFAIDKNRFSIKENRLTLNTLFCLFNVLSKSL